MKIESDIILHRNKKNDLQIVFSELTIGKLIPTLDSTIITIDSTLRTLDSDG